jgi:hypothetical protein
VILLFDSPQTIRKIGVEIEELAVSRTQELSVSVSSDRRRTYRALVRQEFDFSPPGTSFERELWFTSEGAVTHLRLEIKPDKGGRREQATLTSLTLEFRPLRRASCPTRFSLVIYTCVSVWHTVTN